MESLPSFVAIDFETATRFRHSICEIGIAIVENGAITATKSWLVQPPGNEFNPVNTLIHGIDESMTKDALLFQEVWPQVASFLQGRVVVAHNTAFDMYALRDALDFYGMEYPTFTDFCSLRLARYVIKGLPNYTISTIYRYFMGRDMETHHRAGYDAEACAIVFLECLKLADVGIEGLEAKFRFRAGSFSPGCFIAQKAKKNYSNKKGLVIPTAADTSKFDPDNYFFGKSVCFTGAFSFATRKNLLQWIADIGGVATDAVTRQTDVLVVGQQNYRVVGEDGISGKQKKALELLEKGQDIEILSEKDFLGFM